MASNDAHSHARHRRYFLQDIPLEEALTRWFGALENAGALNPTDAEPVALDDPHIVGRITAGPVWAIASSPHYDAAAMDGIAVLASDTIGATETAPVSLIEWERRPFGWTPATPCLLIPTRW